MSEDIGGKGQVAPNQKDALSVRGERTCVGDVAIKNVDENLAVEAAKERGPPQRLCRVGLGDGMSE